MPPSRERGQGQWARGHYEPLNASEQMKKDDDGLAVRERILHRYARGGFASIDPTDLRGRFRWWGLYTQRRPGIPGGKTGALAPEELDDELFMLRVRIPGGRLTSHQLATVAGLATTYGRDVADVTDRQNIQLHWVRIEDVPAIWAALEAVGLSTQEACGDTPRNMLGCPVAGVDAAEVLDATPALLATNALAEGNPEFSNLPRKYKTAISGCAARCTAHEINDVSFVGVRTPDGRRGFDLWVGGGLSTNPRLAGRLDAFVEPEQVPEVWAGVTGVFRDYGYRRLRSHARLKFLVADWGVDRFRDVLEKSYLGWALPPGPAPTVETSRPRDHVGVHRQVDGRYYVGFALRVGRTSGTELAAIAELAERYGCGEVRATVEQKMVILGVEQPQVAPLTAELEALGLSVHPSPFRRAAIACTGIEFCKLALVETKSRAAGLVAELERRLPDFPEPVSLHVNGCPNSCARFQLADVGLKGGVVNDEEVFQVHLGGALGDDAGFGRKERGLKVRAEELADYTEHLLRHYLQLRQPGESLGSWLRRADPARLAWPPQGAAVTSASAKPS